MTWIEESEVCYDESPANVDHVPARGDGRPRAFHRREGALWVLRNIPAFNRVLIGVPMTGQRLRTDARRCPDTTHLRSWAHKPAIKFKMPFAQNRLATLRQKMLAARVLLKNAVLAESKLNQVYREEPSDGKLKQLQDGHKTTDRAATNYALSVRQWRETVEEEAGHLQSAKSTRRSRFVTYGLSCSYSKTTSPKRDDLGGSPFTF
jgi:hypothetical protein